MAISDSLMLIQDFIDKEGDPRVKDWFMMSSPLPTAAIILVYVCLVKFLGPKLMEKRKPFELKKTLIVYNFLQVVLSAWLFYRSIQIGWFTTYSWTCEPIDRSPTGKALEIAASTWYYYMSKFPELLDTIFFVMRKRYDQVSPLHVIHHGIMPLSTWFGVKFGPGGHGTFFGLLNTFVHIIMYSYYMLAAFGPEVQKYLWWKKYLTQLQIIQFVLVLTHSFQLYFRNDCNYPMIFSHLLMFHAVMFLVLFLIFYKKSYSKTKKSN